MSTFFLRNNLSCVAASTNSSTYTSFSDTIGLNPWDSSKYDGISAVYFEITLKLTHACAPNGSPTAYAELYNQTDGSSISGSEVSTTTVGSFVVLRSGDISANMPSGNKKILIRLKTQSSCATVEYRQADLIIVLSNSTKWRQWIHVGSNEFTTSTSYVEYTARKRFLFTSGNWDGTVSYMIGGTLTNNTVSVLDTMFADLYDVTAGATVSGSEISELPSNTPAYYTSSTFTLTDGNDYTGRQKTGSSIKGTGNTTRNLHLIIDQSDTPTKLEAHYQLLTRALNINNTAYTDSDFKFIYDTATFSNCTRTLYHEGVLRSDNAIRTTYMQLTDDGSAMTNSEISENAVSYERNRSASLTEPADGSEIEMQYKRSSGTGSGDLSHDRFILTITGLEIEASGSQFVFCIGG